MGLTRKERLLKAMLEDNADACGGGVTREERLLARTAKKACENDVLEGGGGSAAGGGLYVDENGAAVIRGNLSGGTDN